LVIILPDPDPGLKLKTNIRILFSMYEYAVERRV